jgi:hypothetical protein
MTPKEKQEIEIEKPHDNTLPSLHQPVARNCSDFLGTALIINRKRLSLHGITLLFRKKSCQEGEQPYEHRV